MKIGILKGQFGQINGFSKQFANILSTNGIDHVFLDVNQVDFWEQVSELTALIYRWNIYDYDRQVAKAILPVIERDYNVSVFPNQKTCWHYDDKIVEYYMLKAHGFPMTESWIFWDRDAAIQWACECADYPVVFKLKSGASSNGVVIVRNSAIACKLIKRMFASGVMPGGSLLPSSTKYKDFNLYKFARHKGGNFLRRLRHQDVEPCWIPNKNYALFQKFLPENDFDTRVTVIGNRAYGFRRFNRANDFRSSGSGKIDLDPKEVDLKHVSKAFEISSVMGFQSMAYDFIYNEKGESEFCEISYTYLDTVPHDCPGYWDEQLNWHDGHFWPQLFILQDLLDDESLVQADL